MCVYIYIYRLDSCVLCVLPPSPPKCTVRIFRRLWRALLHRERGQGDGGLPYCVMFYIDVKKKNITLYSIFRWRGY